MTITRTLKFRPLGKFTRPEYQVNTYPSLQPKELFLDVVDWGEECSASVIATGFQPNPPRCELRRAYLMLASVPDLAVCRINLSSRFVHLRDRTLLRMAKCPHVSIRTAAQVELSKRGIKVE